MINLNSITASEILEFMEEHQFQWFGDSDAHLVSVLQDLYERMQSIDPYFLKLERENAELKAELERMRIPDMIWDADCPEREPAEHPREFAVNYFSDMGITDDPLIINVLCARNLPSRKLKMWAEYNPEDKDELITFYEWI